MGEREEGIIETKLDILISDFQRHRDDQVVVNKEVRQHSSDEDEVQAQILTTLTWHKRIGSFMMVTLMYILYRLL